jgi:hypothetical protein
LIKLFLDVDGVVSPFPHGKSKQWPDFRKVEYGFNVSLSQEMGDTLATLPVERIWLTTWEDLANEIIAPELGWELLPVLYRRGVSERPWWKLNALLNYLGTFEDPFIWVDDDIRFVGELQVGAKWLFKQFPACRRDKLLISPMTTQGIRKADIELIKEFVEKHS